MEPVTASLSTNVLNQGLAKPSSHVSAATSENEESAFKTSDVQESPTVRSDTDALIGTHLDVSA
jgi:hypothetical protein